MNKNVGRYMLIIVFGLLMMLLVGCGGKSQESIVKKMEGNLSSLDGYKTKAEMMMKTGQEEQTYDIDVWFKKEQKDYYRVELQGEEEDGGQVILKNDEGVFVLTPTLKKSFKFQADWPESSSQPYLYQSLVNDILKDKEAQFTTNDTHYVFLTKTNYQNNKNLPFQEVHFEKKSLTPSLVRIMDKDKNVLVEVTFKGIDVNPSFQKNDFNREAILDENIANSSVVSAEQMDELAVMFPLETLGSDLIERKEVTLENGERVIMTFKGEKNFTLIQERATDIPASFVLEEMSGEVVNIGHNIGALSNNTLQWNDSGTDFHLASEDMTVDELIEVAISIQGKEVK